MQRISEPQIVDALTFDEPAVPVTCADFTHFIVSQRLAHNPFKIAEVMIAISGKWNRNLPTLDCPFYTYDRGMYSQAVGNSYNHGILSRHGVLWRAVALRPGWRSDWGISYRNDAVR